MMNLYPKNILVVADAAAGRKAVIRKIAALNAPGESVFHLLHVVKSWNPFVCTALRPPFRGLLNGDVGTYVSIMLQLQDWKQDIEEVCPGAAVRIHIEKAYWVNKAIVSTTRRLAPDLVILARGRRNRLLSSIRKNGQNSLLEKLHCPVIIINNIGLRQNIGSVASLTMPVLHAEN